MRYFRTFIVFILFLSLLPTPQAFAAHLLSAKKVQEILRAAGSHLANMQEPSGRYKYEFNPFTNEFTNDDNMVRQVAAVYSMSLLYSVFEDPIYLERMKRTAEYWLNKSETAEKNGKILRFFAENGTGKLGSNALFIIGTRILKQEDPAWWNRYKSQIEEVENTILWLQHADGGFAQYINASMDEATKEAAPSSDYFDGEAVLALLVMHEYEAKEEWKDAIYRALSHLEKTYSKKYFKGLYLWNQTAMRLGWQLFEDERFFAFAERQEELKRTVFPHRKPNSTNNICTLFEGLSQWVLLQKERGENPKEDKTYLSAGLQRISKLQVKKGKKMKFEMNGLVTTVRPQKPGYGGFLTSLKKPVQRIDFQQHCISAFTGYYRVISE